MKWFPESKDLVSCACSEGTRKSVARKRLDLAMVVVGVRQGSENQTNGDGCCP